MVRALPPTLLLVVLALCGCSQESAPASTPLVNPEAGLEASDDAPTSDVSAQQDALLETTDELQPEAAPDVTEEAPAEAAPEAATGWPGSPWYGCTAEPPPSDATVVTVFDQADHYFNPEDRRTIEASVDFPAANSAEKVEMWLELDCPADGNCDNWDRFANIMLVQNPGANEVPIELARYMTPYNIGMCVLTDVSQFLPLLSGTQLIRSFIDTWVGPNEPVHGHGWRVSLKLIFHPKTAAPPPVPSAVIPLWPYTSVLVGEPLSPVNDQAPAVTVQVPASTTKAELHFVSTGHGQGNRNNCAEFCRLNRTISVNDGSFAHDPWRSDCSSNPIGPSQAGTWKYARAGWCPGAYVIPKVFDVTSAIVPGQGNTFAYSIALATGSAYENTCRPGAGGAENQCTGCAFDSKPGNCDYNGGNHTEPRDLIAAYLFLYD